MSLMRATRVHWCVTSSVEKCWTASCVAEAGRHDLRRLTTARPPGRRGAADSSFRVRSVGWKMRHAMTQGSKSEGLVICQKEQRLVPQELPILQVADINCKRGESRSAGRVFLATRMLLSNSNPAACSLSVNRDSRFAAGRKQFRMRVRALLRFCYALPISISQYFSGIQR